MNKRYIDLYRMFLLYKKKHMLDGQMDDHWILIKEKFYEFGEYWIYVGAGFDEFVGKYKVK